MHNLQFHDKIKNNNPNPDLDIINAYSKFGKKALLFTRYHPETKIWVCLGQITPQKFDEICPLAIPKHISLRSMHIASLVKIPCYLLKLSSGNENMGLSRADNSVKI